MVKKSIVLFLLSVFLISFATAGLLDSADFNEEDGEYGSYVIDSIFPTWLGGEKRADIKLIENTDQCLINCYSRLEGYFYKENTLLDKIEFMNSQGDIITDIKDLTFLIGQYKNITSEIPIYENQCNKILENNGSSYLKCIDTEVDTKNRTVEKFIWENYTGEEILGYYQLEIRAEKNPHIKTDWVITIFGEELIKWEWWSNDWKKKLQINITEHTGGTLTDYHLMFNITYDIDMNPDYSDFRFLNLAEDTELNYYILPTKTVNESSAIVWVEIPELLASVNTTIYLYYNNSDATTTSNGNNTFLYFSDFENLDNWETIAGTPTITSTQSRSGNTSVALGDNTDRIATPNSTNFELIKGRGFYSIYIRDTTARVARADWLNSEHSSYGSAPQKGTNNKFENGDIYTMPIWTDLGIDYNKASWNDIEIRWNADTDKFYMLSNDVSSAETDFGAVTTDIDEFSIIGEEAGADIYLDLFYVAKYTYTNEPTYSIGQEQDHLSVTTTLISPLNNSNQTITDTYFNYTSTPVSVNLTNSTLYIWYNNGTLLTTIFNSLSGNETVNTTEFYNFTEEGSFLWNVESCAEDVICSFGENNYTIIIHLTSPKVEISAPKGFYNRTANPEETLIYNISETGVNITEHLEECWYVYNGTNNNLNCSGNQTNFTYIDGQNNITIFARDTFGLIGNNITTWEYLFEKFNLSYETPVYEGSLNTFSTEIQLGGGNSITQAIFNYNNTNYTTSIVFSGGEYLVSSSITAPIINNDTNISFGFYIVINGETYKPRTDTQEVLNLDFGACGVGDDVLLNISLVEEKTKTEITGNIELNAQLIGGITGEVTESTNLSFENVSYGAICLTPVESKEDFFLNVEIRYDSTDHVAEFYNIQSANLSQYPKNLTVFDLALNDSTEFLIKYQDESLITVEGAVIQLQRKYIGSDAFEVVEAPLTSDIGTAIVHIDLNTNLYRATVVKDGVVLDTFDNLVFNCENELSGQCTESLLGKIDSQNTVTLETLNDFTYSVSEVNNTITTLFSIPSGTPSSINILLTQTDTFGNVSLCNQTIVSSAGSIDCEYLDTIGDSIIQLEIKKDNELQAIKEYVIYEESGVDFLDNNFFIVFILALSLVGMAFSSPEWIVMNTVITLLLAGSLWLLNGLNFVMGLGSLIWLVVGAGIIIMKLSKQEDR